MPAIRLSRVDWQRRTGLPPLSLVGGSAVARIMELDTDASIVVRLSAVFRIMAGAVMSEESVSTEEISAPIETEAAVGVGGGAKAPAKRPRINSFFKTVASVNASDLAYQVGCRAARPRRRRP